MNKLLIVLLAVCLVSVHAFVKRDTEAAATPNFETVKNQLQDVLKSVQDEVAKALNPEEIKKNFANTIDSLTKAMNDFQAKNEAPKQ